MYISSFLCANTNANTNTFEKNKKYKWVKILPKNVFEDTKTNTFNLYIYYKVL